MSLPESPPPYRGRFAPSPSGPLHFGSLVAALASWLDARAAGGRWLLRIEDLDPPRVVPGAADAILRTLEGLGLTWDESVLWQRSRSGAYEAALQSLAARGKLYSCSCSRREIADSALPGLEGPVYPGTCRQQAAALAAPRSLRVRTDAARISFTDRVQGPGSHDLERQIGDYVVRRADRIAAYQLAVVIDDAAQGITDVVRGADLLASTTRQIHLQRLLGLTMPRYAHVPVVVNAAGEKLSKQTGARALTGADAKASLRRALLVLGQQMPPPDLGQAEMLPFAVAHWDMSRVPAGPVPT